MRTHQQWLGLFVNRSASNFLAKCSAAAILGLLFLGVTLGVNAGKAHAQSFATCGSGDRAYTVVGGDTLAGIASRYGTTYMNLAAYNHISNPNLIYVNQVICIPGTGSNGGSSYHPPVSQPPTYSQPSGNNPPVGGSYNVFPYGSCTWWANERYRQLHGYYVPWTINSEAWEWTARAYQFGWHVSSLPTVGAIVDLQPWVEGAYGGGHVAVVEQVLPGNRVIASNMSWGAYPWQVTYVQFTPGPGVTFISR
ncbi:MAG TPA: LysM peptidoglycan-binding domain-containing protein [Ktedonobacteraceae bacterium]|jgi:surface antigen|nr:LysM peptidoglycan-binding domain-containing protein [Ktedonobacteraceae bacterium]